jgi:hypothetical protein
MSTVTALNLTGLDLAGIAGDIVSIAQRITDWTDNKIDDAIVPAAIEKVLQYLTDRLQPDRRIFGDAPFGAIADGVGLGPIGILIIEQLIAAVLARLLKRNAA